MPERTPEILREDLGSHYLYLSHDRHGKILEFLTPFTGRFTVVTKELVEAGTLAAFFDFAQFKKLPDRISLYQSRPFKRSTYPIAFVTSLPRAQLSSRRWGDHYLGRLALMEFLPNFLSTTGVRFLFADRKKHSIIGFQTSFHALFRQKFPVPEAMLGKTLPEFLDPDPLELQAKALRAAKHSWLDQAPAVYRKDFTREKLGEDEETPYPLQAAETNEGLEWSVTGREPGFPESHFITLPEPLNTRTSDFKLTVRFRNLRGAGPLLILGSRFVREDRLPDNSGYLAGRDRLGDAALIKRTGYVVDRNMAVPPAGGGSREISLCKTGDLLLLLFDGEPVASYSDNAFVHNPAALFTLALRRNDACVLHSVTLRAGDTREARPASLIMISTRSSPVQHFEAEPFYNNIMQEPEFRDVAAYFLHDITEMNNRIRSLDQTVKRQLREGERLRSLIGRYEARAAGFLGSGPMMEKIRQTAAVVAPSNATVLIQGPTGSGKEVLARHIHSLSPRREAPFIKVDCATIPRSLMESQLFGHEKGAFTGAHARALGLLERADRGTVFLDEVGNLTPETQAKLLQFFNDFTITRVGGTSPVKLDVRCIAASNAPLTRMVADGLFREDLYYRINAVQLTLPPLKDHAEDIPELAAHFLEAASRETRREIRGFTPEALEKLSGHAFHGNIRELENAVHRAALFCQGERISAEDLQFAESEARQKRKRKDLPGFHLSRTEPGQVESVLRRHQGRLVRAAREMGVSRVALYQYLRKHKLDIGQFRQGYSE